MCPKYPRSLLETIPEDVHAESERQSHWRVWLHCAVCEHPLLPVAPKYLLKVCIKENIASVGRYLTERSEDEEGYMVCRGCGISLEVDPNRLAREREVLYLDLTKTIPMIH